MSWVKIDDKAWCHPKFMALSASAVRLWLFALCWCNQHEQDGLVPAAIVKVLGGSKRDVTELVKCGLWEVSGPNWSIHDFLKYQPSRAQRNAQREATRGRVAKHRNGDVTPLQDPLLDSLLTEEKQPSNNPTRADAPTRARSGRVIGDLLQGESEGAPIVSLDPAQPIRLPPTWDPGFGVFMGTSVPEWAHPLLLERYRSYHCPGSETRTIGSWRQSYTRWACTEWQDARKRPSRPEEPSETSQPAESREARQARLKVEFERAGGASA